MSEAADTETPARPPAVDRGGEDRGARQKDAEADGEKAAAMASEVHRGLSRPQKEVASKYFYDRRGSELFERITELPEYYLTRSELELLRGPVRRWIEEDAPATLVELGAGSARKTRVVLQAMRQTRRDVRYVPIDVSADFLDQTAGAVRDEFPGITVHPVVADIMRPLSLDPPPPRPVLFALLGSTIGNFPGRQAHRLVRRLAGTMRRGDAFLLGVDLRPGRGKPVEEVEGAYDDAAGVTERFNRNVLHVLNRRLGTDFEPGSFRHRAFYDSTSSRIEMHLVSDREQIVRFPGRTDLHFEAGETIRTEVSCKYDREAVERMIEGADLELERWFVDDGRYAVAVAERVC